MHAWLPAEGCPAGCLHYNAMFGALQVDYAAAGIFLNISSNGGKGSAPWWTRPDVQVAPGIEALVPVSRSLTFVPVVPVLLGKLAGTILSSLVHSMPPAACSAVGMKCGCLAGAGVGQVQPSVVVCRRAC